MADRTIRKSWNNRVYPDPDLHKKLLESFRAVRRVEAQIIKWEADGLAFFSDSKRRDETGYSSFYSLVTEELKLGYSTAKDRVVLHRAMAARPEVEKAFLDGRISICQVVALRRIFCDPSRSAEQIKAWMAKCVEAPVKEIAYLVRKVLRAEEAARRKARRGGEDAGGAGTEGRAAAAGEAASGHAGGEAVPEADGSAGSEAAPEAGTVAPAWGQGPLPDQTAARILESLNLLGAAPDDGSLDDMLDALDDGNDAERDVLRFSAPPAFKAAVDEVLDLTRAHIGYDAPASECWRVILTEADVSGPKIPEAARKLRRARKPKPVPRIPPQRIRCDPAAIERAESNLQRLNEDIRALEESKIDPLDGRPWDLFALKLLGWQRAAIHSRSIRLIRDMRDTCSLYALGYDREQDFIEGELHLSEREGRAILRLLRSLDHSWAVDDAFTDGDISASTANMIARVSSGDDDVKWVKRACEVSGKQFAREVRFIEDLRLADTDVLRLFPGVFPHFHMEAVLCARLIGKYGWNKMRIKKSLRAAGIPRPSGAGSLDPAANPSLMLRLEHLLKLLQNETWDTDPPVPDDPLMTPSDRHSSGCPDAEVRLAIEAPKETIDLLRSAIWAIRARTEVPIPVWAAMTVILKRASDAMERQIDPEKIPKKIAILRRDRFR